MRYAKIMPRMFMQEGCQSRHARSMQVLRVVLPQKMARILHLSETNTMAGTNLARVC